MTERALIHRELVRQTALLFFVFALLFALLGAGVYSMVSSNIYRNADENLQAIGMESDYITLDAAGSGSAIVDDVVVEEPDGAAPSDATAIDDLSLTLQQSIVDADPQFITLIRNEQGDLLETVGLYASFIISIVIAVFGARPAMVSAAAGSVALVAAPLVASHGLPYLLAAGLLAGAMQIAFGLCKMGSLVRFVSSSVRTGFVNALAILIFSAQLPHLQGANTATWAMLALGLALIYGLPWLGQRLQLKALGAIPSPLICVLVLTLLGSFMGLPLKTVADLGHLPDSLPLFALPEIPASLETLRIIALPALAIAMVGLLESVLTAAGMSLANLVRLNVYTTDVDAHFHRYGVLAGRLGEAGVAPTTMLGVTRLAIPGQVVELEGTAVD